MTGRIALLAFAFLIVVSADGAAQSWHFERLEYPFGGTATGIVTAPDGTLYTGTEFAGIFRSVDGGETWEDAFDPVDNYLPQVAYDDGTVIALAYGNTWILRNHDRSGAWRRFEFYGPLGARYVWTAAAVGGVLFIGTDNGLGMSGDTGSTWQLVAEEGRGVFELCVAGSTLYLISEKLEGSNSVVRLTRSSDTGRTWQALQLPLNSPWPGVAADTLGLLVHLGDRGLMRWSIAEDTLKPFDPSLRTEQPGLMATSQGGEIVLLAGDSLRLYAGDGSPLHVYALPAVMSETRWIDYAPDGTLLFGARGHGVLRSKDDGISWRQHGLHKAARFYSLEMLPDGDLLASIEGRGMVRTSDPATGWDFVGPDTTDFYHTAVGPDGTWWVSLDRGTVAYSSDEGASWRYDSTGYNLGANALMVTANGSVLIGTNGGIVRSDDGGETWNLVSQGHNAYHFALAPNGTIWSAGFDVILRSDDDGATWHLFEPSVSGLPTGAAAGLTVTAGGSILAQLVGAQMPLIRSDDDGVTWHNGACPCEDGGWQLLTSGSRIFTLTYCGLFFSDDDGRSWEYAGEIPDGLTEAVMRETEPGLFFMATDQGMYRVSQTSSAGSEFLLPERLDLR